jgi:hypothetical protein
VRRDTGKLELRTVIALDQPREKQVVLEGQLNSILLLTSEEAMAQQ